MFYLGFSFVCDICLMPTEMFRSTWLCIYFFLFFPFTCNIIGIECNKGIYFLPDFILSRKSAVGALKIKKINETGFIGLKINQLALVLQEKNILSLYI